MGFSLRQALVVDMETFNKIEFLCPVKQHETPRLWRSPQQSQHTDPTSQLCWMSVKYFMPLRILTTLRLNMEKLLRLFFLTAFICVRARSTCTQSDGFFLLSFPTFFPPPPTVKTTVVYTYNEVGETRNIRLIESSIDPLAKSCRRFSLPCWLLFTRIVICFHFLFSFVDYSD